MKNMCWDTRATDSIIKSDQEDTEASIHNVEQHAIYRIKKHQIVCLFLSRHCPE